MILNLILVIYAVFRSLPAIILEHTFFNHFPAASSTTTCFRRAQVGDTIRFRETLSLAPDILVIVMPISQISNSSQHTHVLAWSWHFGSAALM
jgi:hypothetical protein